MSTSQINMQTLVEQFCREYPPEDVLHLQIAGCMFRIESNSRYLINSLRHYYQRFVSTANNQAVVIGSF